MQEPPGQSSKLDLAYPKILFRPLAVHHLDQQSNDQGGLQNEERYGADDLPSIQIPQAGLSVAHVGPGRQARLAEAPTPHLSPVDHVLVGARLRPGNRIRSLACHNSQAETRRIPSRQLEAHHAASDNSTSNVGAHVAVDRSVGLGRYQLERLGRNERLAGAVLEDVHILNDALAWKMGYPLPELVHRQSGQVHELQSAFVTAESLARRALPAGIEARAAYDDKHAPGHRLEAQGELERAHQVHLDRNTDHIGRKLARLNFLLVEHDEHQRHPGENRRAILEREVERGCQGSDEKIDLLALVLLPQEVGQESATPSVLEARDIERLETDLKLLVGAARKGRAKPLIESRAARASHRIVRSQHDDGPEVARSVRPRAVAEQQQGGQRNYRQQLEPSCRPRSCFWHQWLARRPCGGQDVILEATSAKPILVAVSRSHGCAFCSPMLGISNS